MQALPRAFRRGNWELFDNGIAVPARGACHGSAAALSTSTTFTRPVFAKFTLTRRDVTTDIFQRLTYAKALDRDLVNDLAAHYLASGRIGSLWKEISLSVIVVNCYNFLQPLLQGPLLA